MLVEVVASNEVYEDLRRKQASWKNFHEKPRGPCFKESLLSSSDD